MLPSEAPMPPCAATVCERVGNTLDKTATFRPARASCSDARMPEPPAPTITTSNLRLGIEAIPSEPPQHLHRPTGAADQPDDGGHLQQQAQPHRLDVVHPDVAHADPGMQRQRNDDDES